MSIQCPKEWSMCVKKELAPASRSSRITSYMNPFGLSCHLFTFNFLGIDNDSRFLFTVYENKNYMKNTSSHPTLLNTDHEWYVPKPIINDPFYAIAQSRAFPTSRNKPLYGEARGDRLPFYDICLKGYSLPNHWNPRLRNGQRHIKSLGLKNCMWFQQKLSVTDERTEQTDKVIPVWLFASLAPRKSMKTQINVLLYICIWQFYFKESIDFHNANMFTFRLLNAERYHLQHKMKADGAFMHSTVVLFSLFIFYFIFFLLFFGNWSFLHKPNVVLASFFDPLLYITIKHTESIFSQQEQ